MIDFCLHFLSEFLYCLNYGSNSAIATYAYIAEDTGGDIKNNRLDIFVDTKKEAIEKGRVKANVYMIERE